MDATRFDAFTKALATSTSRRQALRRIGGAFMGIVLASLLPQRALADNSDCAHFCDEAFPPGTERGKCKSDAAHGTGLCFECGPAAPGTHGPLCGQYCCPPDWTCCPSASGFFPGC